MRTKQCDTEDPLVFAAFPILDKSREHQTVGSIFTDLTNVEIISRHDVAVSHACAYYAPTVRQERVTKTSEA